MISVTYAQRVIIASLLLVFLGVGYFMGWEWAWIPVGGIVVLIVLFVRFRQ